jgi:hypothetical protein
VTRWPAPKQSKGGASGEPPLAQAGVDAAAEVGTQVRARLARGFGQGEVGGRGEGWGHAAHAGAARAVGPELL